MQKDKSKVLLLISTMVRKVHCISKESMNLNPIALRMVVLEVHKSKREKMLLEEDL